MAAVISLRSFSTCSLKSVFIRHRNECGSRRRTPTIRHPVYLSETLRVDIDMIERFRTMLEDKRQVDMHHRVLHPAVASPVTGISGEVIQLQKLHRVGIVVDVDESPVGQSDGIQLFQIDRQDRVRLFRIGQFQTEGEPAVVIDLRNQPYSLPLIDV